MAGRDGHTPLSHYRFMARERETDRLLRPGTASTSDSPWAASLKIWKSQFAFPVKRESDINDSEPPGGGMDRFMRFAGVSVHLLGSLRRETEGREERSRPYPGSSPQNPGPPLARDGRTVRRRLLKPPVVPMPSMFHSLRPIESPFLIFFF